MAKSERSIECAIFAISQFDCTESLKSPKELVELMKSKLLEYPWNDFLAEKIFEFVMNCLPIDDRAASVRELLEARHISE